MLDIIKAGKIIILSNDLDLIQIVRKIYPYCSCVGQNENSDWIITVCKEDGVYCAKYKAFVYEKLSVNGLYYFLYEIIQVIIEEIMIQNELNILHGSVMERNGEAFIFSAKTNGGKSTLVFNLNYYGYNYISDDYAVIDNDICSIVPVHLPIKLRTLIPTPEIASENVIVRDYNPISIENYYLVRPFSFSENRSYRLRALFLLNRNDKVSCINKLDYKDSYKNIILNSKEPDMKAVKRIASISLNLIKQIDVYELSYKDTFQCWNMLKSLNN